MKRILFLLLAGSLLSANAQNFTGKTDVRFKHQLLQDKQQVEAKSKTASTIIYKALLQLTDEKYFAELTSAGIKTGALIGTIVTAEFSYEQAMFLLQQSWVSRMELAQKLVTRNTKVREHLRADKVYDGLLNDGKVYTGKGVIVGVYDSGLDYKHPDFRVKGKPTQSRIVSLWDQTVTGNKPANFNYGAEWNNAEISDDIDGTPTNKLAPHKDQIGHGTHVTGTAAGNKGVAYEADIVFVKGSLSGAGGFASLTTEILDGVKYIYDKAVELNKPCVVNLSLGTHTGAPHDGTSLLETALDNLVNSRPGFIIVAAAGNEGDSYIHFGDKRTISDSAWTYFQTQISGVPAEAYLTIPQSKLNTMSIAFGLDSTGTTFSPTTKKIYQSQWYTINQLLNEGELTVPVKFGNGATAGTMTVTANMLNTGMVEILFEINEAFSFSSRKPAWKIIYKGDADVHGWVETGAWVQNTGTTSGYFSKYVNPDNAYSVGIPGTAKKMVTIGAYVNLASFVNINGDVAKGLNQNNDPAGAIAFFSSNGPTRDGRIKPEITAPGLNVISSLSSTSTFVQNKDKISDYRVAQSGTSMACPASVGAIALYLQKNPSATYQQVILSLQQNARTDNFTATSGSLPNNTWGYGKLDIFDMLNSTMPVGVRPLSSSAFLELYPNPAHSSTALYVKRDVAQMNIQVVDLSGRVMQQLSQSNVTAGAEISIDLSSLSKGVYLVHLQADDDRYSTRIMIQ
jgi:minor extracellular serine protease Vpr